MKAAYYPGCSLHSSAVEYDWSVRAVLAAVGLELTELAEWSCCGATAGQAGDSYLALALPLRNLVLAEAGHYRELILPCAACYNFIKTADQEVRAGTERAQEVARDLQEIMGAGYQGTVKVTHPLALLSQPVYAARLAAKIRRPLTGLKVVPYYGCLLTRPDSVAIDEVERPVKMDELLARAGAEVRRWSYKTDCCGGSIAVPRTEVTVELVTGLIRAAQRAGAAAVATACPLCQLTLDTRQTKIAGPLPVFFFTELLGLAIGHPLVAKGLKKHVVDPRPLLNSLTLL